MKYYLGILTMCLLIAMSAQAEPSALEVIKKGLVAYDTTSVTLNDGLLEIVLNLDKVNEQIYWMVLITCVCGSYWTISEWQGVTGVRILSKNGVGYEFSGGEKDCKAISDKDMKDDETNKYVWSKTRSYPPPK